MNLITNHSFQPARPALSLLPRPRLAALLNSAAPLQLLVAAPGYGKTLAALAHWDAQPQPKAWCAGLAGDMPLAQLVAAARMAWGLPANQDSSFTQLLADLPAAQPGLLVVDEWEDTAIVSALGELIAYLPAQCRLLLICTRLPDWPLSRWRSQHRLNLIGQAQLALDANEWATAGFSGGEEACAAALGWWAAAQAASQANPGDGGWNAALASWLDEAWFATLPEPQQGLLGVLSLLPALDFMGFCTLTGQAGPSAQQQWRALASCTGPVQLLGERYAIAPSYRVYVTQAWRHSHSASWAQAVARGVSYLLAQDDLVQAAQLALESGLPEQQEQVLQAGGWSLLYNPLRPVLGQLLQQPYFNLSAERSLAHKLLQLAWQIEVEKLPHAVDAELQQLIPQLDGQALAAALALSASIGWQYDNHQRALADANRALASFNHDLHPAYSLALMLQGSVLLVQGELRAAEPVLRRAQAYAARDQLPYLTLEILQRRALLATEMGDMAGAAQLLQTVHPTAISSGLDSAGIRDSSSRLAAWLKLQSLDLAGLEAELAQGSAAAEGLGQRWQFPRRWYAGLQALAQGDMAAAKQAVAWIKQQLGQQFYPYKWHNEAALLQLWLAACQRDNASLQQLSAHLDHCDWQPSLHRDRRRVLLAAARLLSGSADNPAELQALLQRLHEQGAQALAQQLRLILALQLDDRELLLEHLNASAAQQQMFDYLWLGSKAVAALEQLLGAPELAQAEQTLAFMRSVLAHILAPTTSPTPSASKAAPPAGLTQKEWAVLGLIGQQYTNEQIAARLFVSPATVKTHINHIYAKLGIKTRVEAIHLARTL